MTTSTCDVKFIKQQMKQRKISSMVLASLAGYKDVASVNYHFRQGQISPKMKQVLEHLHIKLTP